MNDFEWKNDYRSFCKQHEAPQRRPLIGITGNYGDKGCELAPGYYQSIYEAGAAVVVIPPIEGTADVEELLDRVDGLIFSGGGDLNPLFMGEEPSPALHGICPERDRKELLLLRMALDRQIPMLGICRGIQLLGYVTGGTIIQDLQTDGRFAGKLIKHSQDLDRSCSSHTVSLAEGSLLQKIFEGKKTLAVNSFHHQAVGTAGKGMKVSAQSPDGVVEAIESAEYKSIVGVQWHPETYILRGDRCMMPLFRWLRDEAASYAAARRVHQRVLTLDTHCDTPMFFNQGIRFDERDPKILVDLHKMREGHLDASIMAAYLPQGKRDDASLKAATAYCNQLLDGIEQRIGNLPGAGLARTPADLRRLKHEGRKGIMRAIENGYAIGKDISNIERFRKRGVVYMTLCHNGDNDICDAASRSMHEHHGVSPFGEKVIREMNRVGMMVDLSHGGEESFWQALEISRLPIVCSHASCRSICDHPRNLTDEQLKALAKAGGVCQITFYHGFLRLEKDGGASICDGLEHLLHAVKIMGVEHVGIGTDFDGDGGVPGMADASEVINFTRLLLARHFSEDDIALIWGGNFLRVMQQVQDAAETAQNG
jgi:membrane dipeptidase